MRVIYVSGWLRSGTTVLCQTLGRADGVLALGEVSGIWQAVGNDRTCACGQPLTRCAVWGPPLQRVTDVHGLDSSDFDRLADVARSVLRTKRSPGLARLRHAPQSEWPADVRCYIGVLDTLLTELVALTGSSVLVDSSKLSPGFLSLLLVPSVTVDVLHIVRDPLGVANSERKSRATAAAVNDETPPGRSLLDSAVRWSLANLAINYLAPRHAQSYNRISYESFATDQNRVLRDLEPRLRLTGLASLRAPTPTSHIAVGNPTRLRSSTSDFLVDSSWRSDLSWAQRTAVSLTTLPARLWLRSNLS